jgi:CRP-like cAMP-binding protein
MVLTDLDLGTVKTEDEDEEETEGASAEHVRRDAVYKLLFEVQSTSSWFSGIDPEENGILEEFVKILRAPRGAYLITAGSRPSYLGIIAKGILDVYSEGRKVSCSTLCVFLSREINEFDSSVLSRH